MQRLRCIGMLCIQLFVIGLKTSTLNRVRQSRAEPIRKDHSESNTGRRIDCRQHTPGRRDSSKRIRRTTECAIEQEALSQSLAVRIHAADCE